MILWDIGTYPCGDGAEQSSFLRLLYADTLTYFHAAQVSFSQAAPFGIVSA
jgi:hypothetical protein